MTPDVNALLEKTDDVESAELKIFQNAVIKNLNSYQQDPTKAAKNNLDAAKDALEKKKEELIRKYFPEVQGPVFESTLQVLHHLFNAGYKVSDSKIYRDKSSGLLKVNADGTVAEAEVRAYAATLKRRDGDIDDLSDLSAQKTDKEINILKIKEQRMQFELDKETGRYIPRKDFEAEMAARGVVLETGLRHFFSVKAREIIALVGGKVEKTPDLLQALNEGLDEQLNQYATTEVFQVLFEEEV